MSRVFSLLIKIIIFGSMCKPKFVKKIDVFIVFYYF